MKIIASFLCTLLASGASAAQWHSMGPRAMGMGGAGVAVAQGPLASYWNPAGLAQLYNESGLVIPTIGFRGEATGSVLEGANNIIAINDACKKSNATICNNSNLSSALSQLGQSGNGAMVDVGGSVALKVKRGVFFAQNLAYIGANPIVDSNATANLGGTIANNSQLVLRGASFTEIGFGYAREIRETGLTLGGNLKGIVGKTGYYSVIVKNDDAAEEGFSDFNNNAKTSIQPGVDLGLFWDMRETFSSLPMRPRFGLVGRNINDPRFKNPDVAVRAGQPSKQSLHGQARTGFAISPLKFWHIAADVDLTNNLTPIDGFQSRYLSLGTEINLVNHPRFNLPLRAGIQKNLSSTASGATYTGGLGLNFLHFVVDLAGQISAKRTAIQSTGKQEKVPNNAAASISLGILFGSKDEGGRAAPMPTPKKKS